VVRWLARFLPEHEPGLLVTVKREPGGAGETVPEQSLAPDDRSAYLC